MKTGKRMMRAMVTPSFPKAAALVLSLLSSCGPSISGGGEIGNPKTITGKVVDKNNRGVSGMRVRLLATVEFNPVAASLADTAGKPFETVHPVAEAVTDFMGAYIMTVSLNPESYTLFGQNPEPLRKRALGNQAAADSVTMVYHPFVSSGKEKNIVLIDTAVAPGTVIVGIVDSLFVPNGCVFVKGSMLFAKIDSIGRKAVPCPAGSITLVYYSSDRDSVVRTIPPLQNIYVGESETKDLSGLWHRISKPSRPAGDTLVYLAQQGSGIQYTTGNAVSNLGDVVQYKISWGANSASQWIPAQGSTMVMPQNILWPSTGTYAVYAQARSAKSGVVSPVSDTLMVIVQ